jgi:hypothetical protein
MNSLLKRLLIGLVLVIVVSGIGLPIACVVLISDCGSGQQQSPSETTATAIEKTNVMVRTLIAGTETADALLPTTQIVFNASPTSQPSVTASDMPSRTPPAATATSTLSAFSSCALSFGMCRCRNAPQKSRLL